MTYIDKTTERRIKEAADIVTVASAFLDLKKNGENYMALCPFHDDKHMGSFVISPRKNMCSCFSCGVRYDSISFLMNYGSGMSYGDSLRWLANKYCIPICGALASAPTQTIVRVQPRELPTLTLPIEMVKQRLAQTSTVNNPLVEWLRSLPWQSEDERRKLEHWLHLYGVGTSNANQTHGWTIWWQIDDKMQLRTGKLMKYKRDGHRDKEGYSFNFVHSMLKKAGQWDDSKFEARQCLFGLHLVDRYPDAEVCIVESEKSALIAQVLSEEGKKLFLATGAKSNLTKAKLQPLIDRHRKIIIYPDVDGQTEWEQRVKGIGYDRAIVSREVLIRYNTAFDSEKSDIADIMLRAMIQRNGERIDVDTILLALQQKHPPLATLVNNLNLTPYLRRR